MVKSNRAVGSTTEKEIWIPVRGYEGRYSVSNFGNIVSHRGGKTRILKSAPNHMGYSYVTLCKNGTRKSSRVNVLVANHFLQKPNGVAEVNHKDENKSNNRADNLEWCTHVYNMNYGTRTRRAIAPLCKAVVRYSKSGECIDTHTSVNQAGRTLGISAPHISLCCRGMRKSAGGFKWKFAEEVSA